MMAAGARHRATLDLLAVRDQIARAHSGKIEVVASPRVTPVTFWMPI